MNSHIQFPKVILKKFTDKNNRLFYYDFDEKKIKRGRPKTFNTEEDYYSEIVEKFFSDKIETPLGEVIRQIETINFYEKAPLQDLVDDARNYIYSLISRNPDMITEVKKNSIHLQFMQVKDIRDIVASESLRLAHNADLFGPYPIGIGTTEDSFVLNSRGMIQSNNILLCPITKKRALVMLLSDFVEYEDYIPVFDLTSVTDQININTFINEKEDGRRFVIANSSKQLENLLMKCGI